MKHPIVGQVCNLRPIFNRPARSLPHLRKGPIANRPQVTNLPYILAVFLCLPLSAATVADCTALTHHGKLDQAHACYTTLTESRDPYTRAEGFWGLEEYDHAKDQFEIAVKEQK